MSSDAAVVRRLADALEHAHGLDEVAVAAVRCLTALADVTRAGIALTMVGGRQLRFLTSDDGRLGPAPGWCLVDAYDRLPLNDVVRTGGAVVLGSLDELHESYPDLAADQDPDTVQGLLAFALTAGAGPLGGLLVYSRRQLVGSDDPLRSVVADVAGMVTGALVALPGSEPAPVPSHPQDGDRAAVPVTSRLLPDDATAPAAARRFLREALERWGAHPDVVDSALLCTSEIVTNVVMHVRRASLITAQRRRGLLVVHVDQPASGPAPVIRRAPEHADPLAVAGRGLALVDAIAARWGTETSTANVRVWFELELTGS